MPGTEPFGIVFGGGGMFGAWGAGAWQALEEFARPDLVTGASIGALTAWQVACGATGEELRAAWLDERNGELARLQFPLHPFDGIFSAQPLDLRIQELWQQAPPKLPVGVVVTDLLRWSPRVVQHGHLRWEHLAASCAIPPFLKQRRLDGRWLSDGGLLGSVPMWSAASMGARRILGIHVCPGGFGPVHRFSWKLLSRTARPQMDRKSELVQCVVMPEAPLGRGRDAIFWERGRIERWLDDGYRVVRSKKQMLCDMFWLCHTTGSSG
jgi:predicted acylesterase/phospholipase RssA